MKSKKITKKEQNKIDKKLKNKLWKEVRQRVIDRDGGCILCGKGLYSKTKKGLNVHHLLEKEFKIFRHLQFDERNLITVCSRCHKFGEFSIHKNPIYALEVVKTKYINNYKFLLNEVNRLHGKYG